MAHDLDVMCHRTTVNRVECGTAGGVVVYFEAVEVVHRLRMSAVLDIVKRHSAQYADVWVRACRGRCLRHLSLTVPCACARSTIGCTGKLISHVATTPYKR